MRSLVLAPMVLITMSLSAGSAQADGLCPDVQPTSALSTWGAAGTTAAIARDDSPVGRARDLLARAKLLDEAAKTDEKSAADIATRLPALQASAKAARARADHAAGEERATLVSRAEDLEADLAVSEAELVAKRRAAADNRRVARDLRTRAIRVVKEAPLETTSLGPLCDPPYHFTANGRKTYRVECLK